MKNVALVLLTILSLNTYSQGLVESIEQSLLLLEEKINNDDYVYFSGVEGKIKILESQTKRYDTRKYWMKIDSLKHIIEIKSDVAFAMKLENDRLRDSAYSAQQIALEIKIKEEAYRRELERVVREIEIEKADRKYDSLAKVHARQEQDKKEKRRTDLISQYGSVDGNMIANKKVQIGFTKEMCLLAFGNPDNTSKLVDSYDLFETWRYWSADYSQLVTLDFQNGILIRYYKSD